MTFHFPRLLILRFAHRKESNFRFLFHGTFNYHWAIFLCFAVIKNRREKSKHTHNAECCRVLRIRLKWVREHWREKINYIHRDHWRSSSSNHIHYHFTFRFHLPFFLLLHSHLAISLCVPLLFRFCVYFLCLPFFLSFQSPHITQHNSQCIYFITVRYRFHSLAHGSEEKTSNSIQYYKWIM